MKKRFADIPLKTWEVALRRLGCRGRGEECGIDWGEVARTVFHLSGISVAFGPTPEDWAENMLPGELFEAAELATVGVSFPKSQHGDAVWVTVSAFPGGTVLGLRRDSWEGNDSLVFYLQTPSVEDLDAAARSAAEDALTAMEDLDLVCIDCSATFTTSVSEQEFFRSRGFVDHEGRVRLPIRCESCRRTRKGQRRQEDKQRADVRW